MADQPTLFDHSPGTLQGRFERFHRENPQVFEVFVKAARSLKASGRKRYGAKAIVEHMRFHVPLGTVGEPWKLNNSFTSRYARLLVETYPDEFADFVEMRTLKTE